MTIKRPTRMYYTDTGEEIYADTPIPMDGREVIVKDGFTGEEIRRFKASPEALIAAQSKKSKT